MKRIAIFCDGTWNALDSDGDIGQETNVARLWRALAHESDGVAQLPIYIPGVGNHDEHDAAIVGHDEAQKVLPMAEVNSLKEFFSVKGGGAFGWGLDNKILTAYKFLSEVYDPGDQIYVFGFSRGAYTARSLLGLMRNCGLPLPGKDQNVVDALEYYRSRDGRYAPNRDEMRRIRAWLSPRVATDKADLAMRADPGQCVLLDIPYLGVFDTVGALGVPSALPFMSRVFNRKYQFHDTILSSMIRSARQVVALDDRRITYTPSLFDTARLAELNAGREGTPYRQAWYPGEHGAVGGGMPEGERGLGNGTCLWLAQGAEEAGLKFEDDAMETWRRETGALAPLRPSGLERSGVDRFTLWAFGWWRRPDLGASDEASDLAETRWREEASYAPAPLHDRAAELGWPAKD